MRKITKLAVNAFYNWENFSQSNTVVHYNEGVSTLYLHWNLIAVYDHINKKLQVSDAHRQTNTTKERLNWVLSKIWSWIYQKNWKWFFTNWKEFISSPYSLTGWKSEKFWNILEAC